MATTSSKLDPAICLDIIGFQDYLKRLRLVDDSIILNLNTTVTTTSTGKEEELNIANCKRLHEELKSAYGSRDQLIHNCLNEAKKHVAQLKLAKEKDSNDINITKDLRRNQNRLKMIEKELTVEQIIQDRSLKAIQERCRRYVNF